MEQSFSIPIPLMETVGIQHSMTESFIHTHHRTAPKSSVRSHVSTAVIYSCCWFLSSPCPCRCRRRMGGGGCRQQIGCIDRRRRCLFDSLCGAICPPPVPRWSVCFGVGETPAEPRSRWRCPGPRCRMDVQTTVYDPAGAVQQCMMDHR